MGGLSVLASRIREGAWEAELSVPAAIAPPELDVLHEGAPVAGGLAQVLEAEAGTWRVRVPIPPELVSTGVQTFVVVERTGGALLDRFTILAGEATDGDLRAEVDLLRAELELLKAAFRRHCAQGGD